MTTTSLKHVIDAIDEEVHTKRVFLSRGNQLYALLIASHHTPDACTKMGIPNFHRDNERLTDALNTFINNLEKLSREIIQDVHDFQTEENFRQGIMYYISKFPYYNDSAENRTYTHKTLEVIRNRSEYSQNSCERKFYGELYQKLKFYSEVSSKVLYLKYGYSDVSELLHLAEDSNTIYPVLGSPIEGLLYVSRPATTRALKFLKYNTQQDTNAIARSFPLNLLMNEDEGENLKWYDCNGKIVD